VPSFNAQRNISSVEWLLHPGLQAPLKNSNSPTDESLITGCVTWAVCVCVCVSFVSNPLLQVDVRCVAEQLSAVQLGCWTGGDGNHNKMTSTSKPHQSALNLWCLKDTESRTGLHSRYGRFLSGSTWESAVSVFNFIKNQNAQTQVSVRLNSRLQNAGEQCATPGVPRTDMYRKKTPRQH